MPFFRYSTPKNVVTLKSGSEVIQGQVLTFDTAYCFLFLSYSNLVRKMHRFF